MTPDFDVLIGGGGLVGGSLACALSGHGLRIAVVEAHPLSADTQPGYDDRTVALAYASRRIFEALGLWGGVAEEACPIEQIHVSERGGCGFARLRAESEGIDAWGYVTPARVIGRAVAERLAVLDDVTLISPGTVVNVYQSGEHIGVEIEGAASSRPDARLVVAADGTDSPLRALFGIGAKEWNYGQTAITANISPESCHANRAFERFMPDGPMALLPMTENRCALVCTVPSGRESRLLELDDEHFLSEMQARFGYRLGRFVRVGRRNAHPLRLVRAQETVRPRLAVVGNAAHTLHPVAGQGFNLGLRDVAALAEAVVDARNSGQDFGSLEVLNRFAAWRRWDRVRTVGFTDALVRLFGNPLLPFRAAREVGLLTLDMVPAAKRLFSRNAMGVVGRLPRLARGLALQPSRTCADASPGAAERFIGN